MENKICNKCSQLKAIEDFILSSSSYIYDYKKSGSTCKVCMKEYHKKNYQENKEKISERNKQHYIDNKDKKRDYRIKNAERIKSRMKEYYNQHKKELITKITNYQSKKYHSDSEFKLSKLLRKSLRDSIKKNSKRSSALKLLGCSISEFKKYIESKFTIGMSWDKWGNGDGKFHLDHIRPIASFDLSDIEQQKICFHFTNFQPLWSHENLSKGDLVEHDGTIIRARFIK